MNSRDIGNYIDIVNGGGTILKAGDSDIAIEGTPIDRDGYLSGAFLIHWILDGPSINDQAGIEFKLQESGDEGLTWEDVSGGTIALACVTLAASNVPVAGLVELNVNFSELENIIRGYVTPTRSSIESTSISVAIAAVLGGAEILPV